MTWRRLRVVVEVPVSGKYTEKDLVWAVQRAIAADAFHQDVKYIQAPFRPKFGRVEVKEFSRVMPYEKKKWIKEPFDE